METKAVVPRSGKLKTLHQFLCQCYLLQDESYANKKLEFIFVDKVSTPKCKFLLLRMEKDAAILISNGRRSYFMVLREKIMFGSVPAAHSIAGSSR